MKRLFMLLIFAGAGCAAGKPIDFAHDVLPILKERCAKCHTNGKYKGSFSMDTRKAMLEEKGNVVPGKSGESLLVKLITSTDPEERMPNKGEPLSTRQIATLKQWIDEGLAWEEGFTFKRQAWTAPLKPRRVDVPGGTGNPVDRILGAYYQEHKVVPPSPVDDRVFIRRLYMDVLGLLPPPGLYSAFAEAPDREGLVVSVLRRDHDYAQHWMTFWNDLLRNDYRGTGFIDGGRKQITGWLYQSLVDNKPYDQFVRELISPGGGSEGFIKGIKWRGRVNASQVRELQFAQNISQVFLGENLKCASCHDSFINEWKLTDAYGLAAIISDKPMEMHRCDKPTGQTAKAAFLFPELGSIDGSAPKDARLKQLAGLMTSQENGRLSRTVVNRIWHRMMGRGLVEPVDIMSNRPWSEDLLDFLAAYLADSGYDLKKVIHLIATSNAYQSAVARTPEDPAAEYVFRGPIARRMTAEQFMDAVWSITGAGPAKPDAKVNLASKPAAVTGDTPGRRPPVSPWIWSHAKFEQAAAGEQVLFRRKFEVAGRAKAARVVITCDNEYRLTLNGHAVGGDAAWETVEQYDVTGQLKAGENILGVYAANAGSVPNPAGLYVSLRIDDADGVHRFVTTEKGWEWSAPGKKDWKPAVMFQPLAAWTGAVASALAGGQAPAPAMNQVRASLVSSDPLQRALGRPNREQVVTVRQAELSTLQALDLSNGERFSSICAAGGRRLISKYGTDPTALATGIYLSALGRAPDPGELRLARTIAGNPARPENVADLIWTVFMLPEFQIVQ